MKRLGRRNGGSWKRIAACAVGAAFVASSSRAAAETDAERRAERLFEEAIALAGEGRYADACPRLEESQRLDPGLGTQFNLADCYEHVGRRASAWAAFDEVARQAHASGKEERERLSRARADALAPTLARLTVRAPSLPSDAVVRRDAAIVAPDTLGRPAPVDSGEHVVEASAPGRAGFRTVVRAVDGSALEVVIPDLAILPPSRGIPTPNAPDEGLGAQRIAAIGVGGAGMIALGIGSAFGVLAITRHDDAAAACPTPTDCPTESGAQKWTDATSAGDVSTVLFIGSGVALAGAAVLWFTAPRRGAVSARMGGGPTVGGAAARFELRF